MGRRGNCTTELLLAFLKNPKFRLAPVLALIEKYFVDLKRELKWGYELPFMLTGALNKHPRPALAYVKAGIEGKNQSIVDFYNELVGVDDAV